MSGKKFKDAAKKFDREMLYSPAESVRLAKETATAKFDESIDVSFRLGIDPRKADQMVRGTVALPQGTGKTIRVAVFCPPGEKAEAAKAAAAVLRDFAEVGISHVQLVIDPITPTGMEALAPILEALDR